MRLVGPDLKCVLLLLLLIGCVHLSYGRRGGGGSRGGGSRGGSRGSSSRGSSSSSSSSRGSSIDRSRDRGRTDSRPASPPAPIPKAPEAPKPKPSAPLEPRQPAHNPNYNPNEGSSNVQPAYNPNYNPNQGPSHVQPASNPNYRGQNPAGNQQPPPYSPGGPPPPYSPGGPPPPYSPGAPPPPYSPAGAPPKYAPAGPPPPYSPGQSGIPSANYPRQPGAQPPPYQQQPGGPSGGYPKPPGINTGIPSANYPRQPGVPSANYPRQPGGYPQPPAYPPQTLGSNVWYPQSGRPAPAYMNYGGIPTGANMYDKPHKQKGFLGSLMSLGSHKSHKNKYYGSYPSPNSMGGIGGMGGMGGMGGKSGFSSFMGNNKGNAAMYTILPYMAARQSHKLFKPRFGFMPIFLPSPFHHHHYYGNGYGYGYGSRNYDVYNRDYVGKCNRPLTPENSKITCNSTTSQIDCHVECNPGYAFADNTTTKSNGCWHVTGVWRPTKNYPACKPICGEVCQNGGECLKPGECSCPTEYRGHRCEHYYLNCNFNKLVGDRKLGWVCEHKKNGTFCRVRCKEWGYEFETLPPSDIPAERNIYFNCTIEGVWEPKTIPKCVLKESKLEATTLSPAQR